MTDLHPNCRLWIYSETRPGVFGDGKVRLLKALAQHGSIQGAAQALGVSYRKAWGDLKKAESCLQQRLARKIRGGRGGGRTILTEQGKCLLQLFDRFRDNINHQIQEQFETFIRELEK